MKRYWLLTTVFVTGCILLLHIGCRKQAGGRPEPPTVGVEPNRPAPEPPPEDEKKGPRVRFEKVVHDFGQVGPDTTQRCEFKFTNVGDDVLELRQPKSSCACTVGRLDKLEYAPGESGVLRVTKFRVYKKPGARSQRLDLRTNDKTKGTVSLTVKATVVLKVAYEPKKLKLLLSDTDDACPEIKVWALDGRAFAIRGFRATNNAITADYDRSLKATTHVIRPKINTNRLQRRTRGSINISLTHPECNVITIAFDVLPRFRLKPPSIVLLNAEPEKPTKKEVWVLNNYGEDFEIESVSSDKELMKVLSRQKISDGYKFELEITPPADASSGRFVDVLRINIKGGQKLKVDCNGFYSQPKKSS